MSGTIGSYNIRGSGLVKKLTVDGIDNDAVTLAKLVAGTDGNLISYDTSGNPVAVATGNDGQVLTSAGAGAVCLFEDAAGGANTPSFFAFANAETVIATATHTIIAFDTEVYDLGGGFNTTTYKWTPGEVGYYWLGVKIGWSATITATTCIVTMLKNSAVALNKMQQPLVGNSGASSNQLQLFTVDYSSADTDSYYVNVYQNTGGDANVYGTNGTNPPVSADVAKFWGFKLIV